MKVQFPACKESKRVELDRTYFLDSEGIGDISQAAYDFLVSSDNKDYIFIELEKPQSKEDKKEVIVEQKTANEIVSEKAIIDNVEIKSEDFGLSTMNFDDMIEFASNIDNKKNFDLDAREWRRMDEIKLREYLTSKIK